MVCCVSYFFVWQKLLFPAFFKSIFAEFVGLYLKVFGWTSWLDSYAKFSGQELMIGEYCVEKTDDFLGSENW